MLEIAATGASDTVVDLGSGDGRIVVRAAERFGARSRGVELDPELVRESRAAAVAAGVDDRAVFVAGDLFAHDLRDATVVTLYLLPTVNLALRAKLFRELETGTRVVSQTFDMGAWRPDRVEELVDIEPPATIYLWRIPAAAGGTWTLRGASDDNGVPSTLRLVQTFQQLEGELRGAAETVPVTGELTGAAIELEAARSFVDGTRWRLRGRIDGDRLAGAAWREPGEGSEVIGVRATEEIVGTWKPEPAAAGIGSEDPLARARAATLRIGPVDEIEATARGPMVATGWKAELLAPSPRGGAAAARPVADFYRWGGSVYLAVPGKPGEPPTIYSGRIEGDRLTGSVRSGARTRAWVATRQGPPAGH